MKTKSETLEGQAGHRGSLIFMNDLQKVGSGAVAGHWRGTRKRQRGGRRGAGHIRDSIRLSLSVVSKYRPACPACPASKSDTGQHSGAVQGFTASQERCERAS
jgi:hypothetical protein